jgi:hypothetical protein
MGVDVRRSNVKRPNMPFLFWMPMLVMCGLWQVMEDDLKLSSATTHARRRSKP